MAPGCIRRVICANGRAYGFLHHSENFRFAAQTRFLASVVSSAPVQSH